ncbi:hypothetical protein J437_LFUL002801 [Ladona fulva]|uniref:Uncharacterized protein n=1 Tax=Ladona fulva TaxID=123851 RepID=A0A8K0K4E7_LADFU|nr:hypothetical protein J437_LFUL002801 [Ladona fulva]
MQYPFLAAPSFLRPVAIFAGVSSSIQALVYIALTTIGILVYQCKVTVEDDFGGFNKCVVEMYFHALTVIIGVCAIGMYSRASEDQTFLQNSTTSPFFFDPVESVNSITFGRRTSVIDAWKSSWRNAAPVHIPKVDPSKKPPFVSSVHGSGTPSLAESYQQQARQLSTFAETPVPSSSVPAPLQAQSAPQTSSGPANQPHFEATSLPAEFKVARLG